MTQQFRKKSYILALIAIAALVVLGINAGPRIIYGQNSTAAQKQLTGIDWNKVWQAMGKAGEKEPGEVYTVNLPRTDLPVSVLGVQLKPASLDLETNVEFMQTGQNKAMAMGELALTENEVAPVMQKLEQGGIEITALHNHLLGETPTVMYIHVLAQGNPISIAQKLHNALALTSTPLGLPPSTPQDNSINLDTQKLDQIMRYKGKADSGVYQYSIPRAGKIIDRGVTISPAMGASQDINFQPTGNGTALITGEWVLKAGEINPVIKALSGNGIQVVAVHSHTLTEQPRLFYLHFQAKGDAIKLSQALRLALNNIH